MEKFNWMTVLEIVVAGILVGLALAIISGPMHRMAARMHGHCHDGKAWKKQHDEEHEANFENSHFERSAA